MKPIPELLYGYVDFHAKFNPQAHAVRYSGGVINYRQFRGHIDMVTARLAQSAPAKGSVVALQFANPYLHWLSIFASQRLGLISSALGEKGAELGVLQPAAVLTDMPQQFGGVTVINVAPDWVSGPEPGAPAQPYPAFSGDDPTRIVLSSGTTGIPKKALFTVGQLCARVDATVRVYQLTSETELITTIGMTTVAGLVLPLCAWAAGGTVLMPSLKPNDPLWKMLDARPNTMFMSTGQLDGMMRALPADLIPPQRLRIFAAGSILPLAVSRNVRMRLTHDLVNVYGSTEVGTVCISNAASAETRPSFTGFVVPQCEVQIVEDGKAVPNGTPGDIRIRVAGMCSGYLDDPEAHAECFRDGWFHPGDLAVLGDDGSLSIMGRTRELMNFSGVKVAPHVMEEALAGVAGVKELAVFSSPGRDGLHRPCAAVITGDDFDEQKLQERFAAQYPRLPRLAIVRVASIPRNDMNKVSRAELAQSLEGQLRALG